MRNVVLTCAILWGTFGLWLGYAERDAFVYCLGGGIVVTSLHLMLYPPARKP